MFGKYVFCAVLSLSFFGGTSSSSTAQSILTVPNEQALEELDTEELTHQIRRDKFDLVLPKIMRERNIDMWIQVMTEGILDPMRDELGSNNGVFIFTDRGGDRIERAVIGHRWSSSRSSDRSGFLDIVQESGAYDIIAEEFARREMPGGPKTELDYRFKGVGAFVAERDPKRIAVNYLEEMGQPVEYEIPRKRTDGISYTDYLLLVKALGNKYAARIVSAEYLIYDYLSRPVPSEIVMFETIRKWSAELIERDFAKIIPDVTKFSDLETGGPVWGTDDGNKRRGDDVIQRGDLIQLLMGMQQVEYNPVLDVVI